MRHWRVVALGILTVVAAQIGVWAQFFPESFYRSFPGAGRTWVSVDGPYNEHLVRDVGGLQLALASVTAAALVWGGVRLVRIAAIAWLLFGVPHYLYHLSHLGDLDGIADRMPNLRAS